MSKDKKSFEESMSTLEQIVNDLEKGENSLEESLSKFEAGVKLGQACKKIIDDAEVRVKKLIDDGDLHEEDFDGEHTDS